jgi:Flp pilus assembly protein TadG
MRFPHTIPGNNLFRLKMVRRMVTMQSLLAPANWRRFSSDRRGNVAVIFAFCSLVLVGLAGLGIDYYRAITLKARLDLAADAAAIAAINTAEAYIAANSANQSNLTSTAMALGQEQAQKVFQVNAGAAMEFTKPPVITVASTTGQITLSSTVVYQAASPSVFGTFFGIKQINVSNANAGGAQASLTMGKYLDFYLLLDVSGSMGLPSTTSGQTALAKINPDQKSEYPTGCVFACHFSGNFCDGKACRGYTLASKNNIQLRAAAVGVAVQQLLQTAQTSATVPNQFRVGIYPFITCMSTFYALSSNLTGASNAISALGSNGLSALLDTGEATTPPTTPDGCSTTASPYGSGGTNFGNVLPVMKTTVQTIGTGAVQSSPQPFVFLVTDGAANGQYYTIKSGFTGSTPQNMDPSLCTSLKQNGIVISVLYIPYAPITNPNKNFAGDEDDKVNAIIPDIPTTLQQCASPSFFFTANTPQDITNAMQAMFQQSLAVARLTN